MKKHLFLAGCVATLVLASGSSFGEEAKIKGTRANLTTQKNIVEKITSLSRAKGNCQILGLVSAEVTQLSKEVGKDNVERVKERWVASACGRRDVYTVVLTPVDTGVEKFDIVAEQGT